MSRGELKIEYCPTDEMVGDFFTKPTQGKTFRKLRGIILGMNQEELNEEMIRSPKMTFESQECVEKKDTTYASSHHD